MRFKHILAYGNSDQASFRDLRVRGSFDVMTVPGTIASYYSEGTAAFVLTNEQDYIIDPRTPLFQGVLESPRASHETLAAWHGETVAQKVHKGVPATLGADFWTDSVVGEMVSEVIARQRLFADNAGAVEKKMDRYAKIFAEAMAEQGAPVESPASARAPHAVLAPYFAVAGEEDPWWEIMQRVWSACGRLEDSAQIIPVLCVDGRKNLGVEALAALLPLLPPELSKVCFFWITDFDERKADEASLLALWDVVALSPQWRHLVNMYGSFFSICLRFAGLRAFGNGLTYSESRAWPALSSTGAAPPRYYVRDLHLFLPPALAANLVDLEPAFSCPCEACEDWRSTGQTIASLPYHQLKLHFALARQWELSETEFKSKLAIADDLASSAALVASVRGYVSLSGLPSTDYLDRWARVLRAR